MAVLDRSGHCPAAISSAANSVVVSCRQSSWVRRLGQPGYIDASRAVRSSAWIWDVSPVNGRDPVDAQHDRVLRGRPARAAKVDDVRDDLGVGRERERLDLPGRDAVVGARLGHGAVAEPQVTAHQPGRTVGHAAILRVFNVTATISPWSIVCGRPTAGRPAARRSLAPHTGCASRSPGAVNYDFAVITVFS